MRYRTFANIETRNYAVNACAFGNCLPLMVTFDAWWRRCCEAEWENKNRNKSAACHCLKRFFCSGISHLLQRV